MAPKRQAPDHPDQPSATRPRTRSAIKENGSVSPKKLEKSVTRKAPSTSKARATRSTKATVTNDEDISYPETPTKKTRPRKSAPMAPPTTPPPPQLPHLGRSTPGHGRLIMDCVEIRTPRDLRASQSARIGSLTPALLAASPSLNPRWPLHPGNTSDDDELLLVGRTPSLSMSQKSPAKMSLKSPLKSRQNQATPPSARKIAQRPSKYNGLTSTTDRGPIVETTSARNKPLTTYGRPSTSTSRIRKTTARLSSPSSSSLAIISSDVGYGPGDEVEETQTWSEAEPEATVENAVEFGLESSQTDGDAPLSPQPVTPRKSILKPPKPKPPIEEPTPRASKKAAPLRAPLSHHFEAQRRAVLKAALNPPALPSDGVKETPTSQLCSLLRGTVERGEGNSCLVLGSRGSGKTRMVDEALSSLTSSDDASANKGPIIIRLSGHTQQNDKLAMREIGKQLVRQTGIQALDDVDNDDEDEDGEQDAMQGITELPPPAHLPTLISNLTTLPRPTILILEAFDLFTAHARQALLYCLFDAVQSCRAGEGRKGIAVIGVTTRVDCLNLLEKRVKSRFSHRIIRVAAPGDLETFKTLAKTILTASIILHEGASDEVKEWTSAWNASIETLLSDKKVHVVFDNTFDLIRDVRLLSRILTHAVLELTPSSPLLTPDRLIRACASQRSAPRFSFLQDLSYPCLALVIASHQHRCSGHETFTFEALHDRFVKEVAVSVGLKAAQGGMAMGLIKVGRGVMLTAFEQLVQLGVFQLAGSAPGKVVAKQFAKYSSVPEMDEVKVAVEKAGMTMLRRWWKNGQR